MTIPQLRTFDALARSGSVRSAAERLFVTQPAVSSVLAALQRELGVALVARDGRGLQLTAAGRTLASYARRVLGLLDEAATAAVSAAAPERGTVRIAAVTTAGEHLLPRHIAGFRLKHADAAVRLEVANRDRVFALLGDHDVDIVFAGRPPEAQFRSLAVRNNDLVVVASPATVASTPATALARQTWLLREPGSGTRSTVEEYFAAAGISPPTLTLGSNGAIREALVVGLGISLLSADAVSADIEAGRLAQVPAPGMPLRRSWHVIARTDSPLSATAELFVDHLLSTGEFTGE